MKRDLPWRKAEAQDEWKDSDISQLLHWLEVNWNLSGKDKILNAFVHVIRKRTFHPIKDYLEGTKWDGELRVPYLFHNFLGIQDTSFNREISIRWFVGAIRRIYEPGCKHDWGIILAGDKGIGKSWLIQKITPCNAFGELTDFDAKDGGEQLRGKWILEIPELSAKKKSNNEEMKAFMSRQSDDYRAAYARKTETRPRQSVFVGTTNKMEFITDETGDRRNVPLVCEKDSIKMDIASDLTAEYIAQLWAEAKVYFDGGRESYLDKQLAEELDKVNEIHRLTDPLQ
ncbi:virulence-associated E family protein, partial [Campylobacter sp. 1]|uniref:virulence-associated E family protein n=1 Tax=Campylobacter sp. 1 TaxID=2039344 RepID=UPI001C5ECC39